MHSKVKFLYETQAATNANASGEDWQQKAGLHMEIDFGIAAATELLDEFVACALNWKWWAKSFTSDVENAHMELVDVFHFLITEDIVRTKVPIDYLSKSYEFEVMIKRAEESVSLFNGMTVGREQLLLKTVVKKLAINCLTDDARVDWFSFFTCCRCVGLDFAKLYKTYIGKAALNVFRQKNGYKTGHYIKHWSTDSVGDKTKEDNYFLTEWLKTQSAEVTGEEVTEFLERTYNEFLANSKTVDA
jgi:dimeric dUTPase (all-alpha-NTP-PPase superfamily)